LDVYAWTGSGWAWVSSEVFSGEDLIIAELQSVPEQFDFVIAETRALPPVVSADLVGKTVPEEAIGVVVELNPRALTLGDNGEIMSTATIEAGAEASFMIVPILSNVNTDGTIRNDLVDNILVDTALQQTHIENILQTLEENGFHGVEIDYRAINPGLRDPFSDFIAKLADALHQQGRILMVRLELPRQVSYDQWDTGVYDWRSLGQAVDGIKVPSIPDPQAYVLDGRMDQLVRWAISQVSRQQVQFIISTRSVDLRGGNPTYLPYAQAMAQRRNREPARRIQGRRASRLWAECRRR
jgi:spore germination protein YaaH